MSKKFAELLEELATIVSELESGELDLEDSIAKYKRGMELSVLCKERLNQAKEVVVTKMEESRVSNNDES